MVGKQSANIVYGKVVGQAFALTTGPLGRLLFPEAPERFVHGVTFLYAAGIFGAWLGGVGPGLLASLLGVVVVDYFITPPLYSISLASDSSAAATAT